MLSLRTSDGRIHSANTWHDLLRSASPNVQPEATMAALIKEAKRHGYDVLFGQTKDDPPSGNQLLHRLHEVGMVDMAVETPSLDTDETDS